MGLDERILAYYLLHGRALTLVGSTGRVYDPECGDCGARLRHFKPSEQFFVCGRCGAPWGFADVELLKGEVSSASRRGRPIPARRPGEAEEPLAEFADLGYHLNAMLRDPHWRWSAQALVAHAITGCTYEDIATHARLWGWPAARGEWTEAMARNKASKARRELRERLRCTRQSSGDSNSGS